VGTILLCARQELALAVRSRWTQIFAAVFGAMAVMVAAAGYILTGGHGLQDLGRTAASLSQLVLLIVPLTAIVMSVLAVTPERGGAELLYAQPVARHHVVIGIAAGLFAALVGAQAIGFGAAGVVIALQVGDEGAAAFGLVALGSVALTAVFVALGAALGVGQFGRRRVRALAAALVLWLVLALLVDIVALGAATQLRSGYASRLLIASVLANPVGAVRTGALLGIEGTGAFGAATLALFRFTGGAAGAAALIAGSLILWTVLPLAWASRRINAIDI
jgi:Cu-processing system permease protein